MQFTYTHELFPSYSFICTDEKILDFLSVTISFKLRDEILPAMSGRHNLITVKFEILAWNYYKRH